MHEHIAIEAEAEASKAEWMSRHFRELAGQVPARLGYTALTAAWESSRDHIGQAQAHYVAQAEEHERRAAEWRAKAASARRGVIVL